MNKLAINVGKSIAILAVLFTTSCGTIPVTGNNSVAYVSTKSPRNFQSLLNQERARAGLTGLKPSSKLTAAARGHARDMSNNKYFSHVNASGRRIDYRVNAQGYGYCWVAENIAWGQQDQADVMKAWMASSGHRRNNLNPRATEYGLARTSDDYWVLVLGKPGC